MREKTNYDLVLFDSPHQSFAFDSKSKEVGLGGRLIPVPRALSSSCGMCYRSEITKRAELLAFIEEHALKYNRIVEDYKLY